MRKNIKNLQNIITNVRLFIDIFYEFFSILSNFILPRYHSELVKIVKISTAVLKLRSCIKNILSRKF